MSLNLHISVTQRVTPFTGAAAATRALAAVTGADWAVRSAGTMASIVGADDAVLPGAPKAIATRRLANTYRSPAALRACAGSSAIRLPSSFTRRALKRDFDFA